MLNDEGLMMGHTKSGRCQNIGCHAPAVRMVQGGNKTRRYLCEECFRHKTRSFLSKPKGGVNDGTTEH